jgi:all-trans-8'-apo-beta-carotenal 15,15'-oxygenase
MQISRREFSRYLLGAAAIGLVDLDVFAQMTGDSGRSIRRLATATASGEGTWKSLKIDGKIPRDLNGTLFRTAPGESERFGVRLTHLFDGDAYLAGWEFRNGKVSLRAEFLRSPRRIEERHAGKMLFNEYGTHAPDPRKGGKNQPSVNVIEWRGKLLGLSEGGLPTIIEPKSFDYGGLETFDGAVPDYLTFTAHPRFDPITGDMYAFGFERRPPGTLHVIHIERATGKASTLYKVPQTGFNMVHDAMLTENYFIIPIMSTFYDMQAVLGGKPIGEALRYAEDRPGILYAFPRNNKNGNAEPIKVEFPPTIVYHYGNAYEAAPNRVAFEMVAYDDPRFFDFLRSWRNDPVPSFRPAAVKQVIVDLDKRTLVSSTDLYEGAELPRYDMRFTGKPARYLYVTDSLYEANAAVIRLDLKNNASQKVAAGPRRTIAEPVFVPKPSARDDEDRGWILVQGYDADKNENFLEIRDAQTLEFQARVWAAGQHFPLGFHGNFTNL